jgi:hypothetical protein
VAGCCEHGDNPISSGATELVINLVNNSHISTFNLMQFLPPPTPSVLPGEQVHRSVHLVEPTKQR